MPWSPLADWLDTLALILAGPILRQVTPKSVTVWVALGEKADVTLSVLATDAPAGQTPLATATRTTVAIGRHLHIVAVTARTASALTEGKILLRLDLRFAGAFGSSTLTRAMTRAAQLGDASRIAYGPSSCRALCCHPGIVTSSAWSTARAGSRTEARKDNPSYQEAPDALADALSHPRRHGRPSVRPAAAAVPHRRLDLRGDEVADVLLMSLMDAGVALLGWDERLPADRDSANIPFGPYDSSKLLPSTRTGPITNARFTTQDMRSHLMSLGEDFAMYLFAWSEELWEGRPRRGHAADGRGAEGQAARRRTHEPEHRGGRRGTAQGGHQGPGPRFRLSGARWRTSPAT